MTRIVVHEWVSGGGLAEADAATRAELMPMGRAMRDAMLADLLAVPGLRVSVTECAEALAPDGAAQRLQAHTGQAPWDWLAQLASQHEQVWLVAPESDGVLARCQQMVGDARWLGCSAEALRVASSKALTLQACQAAGVTTPLDFAAAGQARRWVVKPDDGAGAVATHCHTDLGRAQAEAAQRRAQGERVTLEPWVEGEAMSMTLMVGRRAELLSLNRQHIRLDAQGRLHFAGVQAAGLPADDARRPALQALADRCWRALPGLRGLVGIDLVWHAQRGPVLIEVNPRVTCAYVGLSALLGRNLAAELLALHADTPEDLHACH